MEYISVFNLGLAGFMTLRGYEPLSVTEEDGIIFKIPLDVFEMLKEEYFNSDHYKFNNILRNFAKKFKARQ